MIVRKRMFSNMIFDGIATFVCIPLIQLEPIRAANTFLESELLYIYQNVFSKMEPIYQRYDVSITYYLYIRTAIR